MQLECAETGDVRRNICKRVLITTKHIDGHYLSLNKQTQ